MNEMKMGVFTYGEESYNFNFKTSLSAYDKQVFVKTVINNIVNDDYYDVVIRDLIFDFTIVEVFTNVDTSFIYAKDEDDKDIDPILLIEHFLSNSNVIDVVIANMEDGLLDELNRAIDLNVQYLTGIQTNPLSESVANLLSTLEKKINEVNLNDMMDMAQKFAGMTDGFTIENIVNAYMNSDVHKENLKEIEESKK